MSASMDEAPPRRLHAIRTTLGFAVLVATIFVPGRLRASRRTRYRTGWPLLLTPAASRGGSNRSGPAGPAHWDRGGPLRNDSGATCVDENGEVTLTEADVNLNIATLCRRSLWIAVTK